MKEGFRQCMAWLHTWTGLISGWVMFFVFVTGTAGYFQVEIGRWMRPEVPMRVAQVFADKAPLLEVALNRLEQVAPIASTWSITLPHYSIVSRDWLGLSIRWEEMPGAGSERGAGGSEQLDPITGAVMMPARPRATAGGFGLYLMHYQLRYLDTDVAIRIVGVCAMLMLLAIVTGVITHKRIFKDFFTLRFGKGLRSWLDAHTVIAVLALPFFLVITYTGLISSFIDLMPAGVNVSYGPGESGRQALFNEYYQRDVHRLAIARPTLPLGPLLQQAELEWGPDQVRTLSIEHLEGEQRQVILYRAQGGNVDHEDGPYMRFDASTGERMASSRPDHFTRKTERVMMALHEGRFADTWTRWLYFLSGLLGCTLIGTGLVLWTVKRRRQHLAASNARVWEGFGLRLVETLNVAALAGLPLAIAAYFWANRLLPVELANRSGREFGALFAVWLLAFSYALLRPLHRAWIEILWAICVAFALLPVLNALTTSRHLAVSIPQRDWVMAGTDITLGALALVFGLIALKVQRKLTPSEAAASGATPSAGVERNDA